MEVDVESTSTQERRQVCGMINGELSLSRDRGAWTKMASWGGATTMARRRRCGSVPCRNVLLTKRCCSCDCTLECLSCSCLGWECMRVGQSNAVWMIARVASGVGELSNAVALYDRGFCLQAPRKLLARTSVTTYGPSKCPHLRLLIQSPLRIDGP